MTIICYGDSHALLDCRNMVGYVPSIQVHQSRSRSWPSILGQHLIITSLRSNMVSPKEDELGCHANLHPQLTPPDPIKFRYINKQIPCNPLLLLLYHCLITRRGWSSPRMLHLVLIFINTQCNSKCD